MSPLIKTGNVLLHILCQVGVIAVSLLHGRVRVDNVEIILY
jgi:hypothetical protein